LLGLLHDRLSGSVLFANVAIDCSAAIQMPFALAVRRRHSFAKLRAPVLEKAFNDIKEAAP
jgi:hypothetical protein